VIEEADYQADVWALLTEYKYCCLYEPGKLKNGVKEFFCNAIETAVETMWSFIFFRIIVGEQQISYLSISSFSFRIFNRSNW